MRGDPKTSYLVGAVLRIGDVQMTKVDLEAALNIQLDRYEPMRKTSAHYAQIDIDDDEDIWRAAIDCASKVGPTLFTLRKDGLIGSASVDLAVRFRDEMVSLTITAPSEAAAILGQYGLDIQFSVYVTSEDADDKS
ncbi:MAG: hypothetical protein JWP16_2393 [Alphaproteobacteria bacterium]|nr:hypothetical protein [Alphaproteobacteria bacterium]MDB5741353.1 hypothetical protein [Alphaproteobacteria bacterium]